MITRVRASLLNLKRPLSKNLPKIRPAILPIPLLIRILELKIPHHVCKHNLQLRHHQALRDAVPRARFKRRPRSFERVEFVLGGDEEALG
jgi:hypothetical protein